MSVESGPRIWIDADACPNVVKEIVYRAAERLGIETWLVANRPLATPRSPLIRSLQVPHGLDSADNEIVARLREGDLVITADIPLAAEVVAKRGVALNPRGERYTTENIGQRLAMRNLMDDLRSTGSVSGGPAPLDRRDTHAFANALDRLLVGWRRGQ